MNLIEETTEWLHSTANVMGMPHRKMLDQSAHIIETCERVIMRSDVMIRQLEISLQAALDKITEQAQRIKELEERK